MGVWGRGMVAVISALGWQHGPLSKANKRLALPWSKYLAHPSAQAATPLGRGDVAQHADPHADPASDV